MNPNLTSLIVAERSDDFARRSANVRFSDAAVTKSRSARAQHSLSGAVRRYFHRLSFAR